MTAEGRAARYREAADNGSTNSSSAGSTRASRLSHLDEKRVALFLPTLSGGGAERVMANLAVGMARLGADVDIVLLEGGGSYLPIVSSEHRVRIVIIGNGRGLSSLPGLVRYLDRHRPRCMISALNYTNLIALWARWLSRSKTRLVLTVHNQVSVSSKNAVDVRDKVLPYLMKTFYSGADEVVAVSDGVATDLTELLGRSARPRTIYNPVVMPDTIPRSTLDVPHPWFHDGGPPVLLGTGRLTPQKDFPTLLKALKRVLESRDCRLLLLGEGPDESSLRALARELGISSKVDFPGFVENPYPYFRRSRLFVLSSRWEGLPTVLIEALAIGTPVVSTDCPSGPREILESGKHGRLVPVGDDEALAQAVLASLDSGTEVDSEHFRQKFGLFHASEQYLSLAEVELSHRN